MLLRIKCFIFIFVLQCPPSLLIPIAQQDAVSTSNTNYFVGAIEQITPNISKVIEHIQQIDVKDVANQVISTIYQVVLGDDDGEDSNNNGTNNSAVIARMTPITNTSKADTAGRSNIGRNKRDSKDITNLNSDNNALKLNNKTIENLKSNSKLITDLINSKINNMFPSMPNNINTFISENILLLLNSSYISKLNGVLKISNENVPINRSRRQLNDTVEPKTLKPKINTRNTFINTKFRRSSSKNQENGTNDVNTDAPNNSSPESSPADKATLANFNNTVGENPVVDDEYNSPAYRLLLPDKQKNKNNLQILILSKIKVKNII